MTEWAFWAGAIGLGLAVVAVLVQALRQAGPNGDTAAARRDAAPDPDLVVYKDQLAEIGRDLARGSISAEEAERLRAEIGRRVLEADRSRREAHTRQPAPQPGRRTRLAAVAAVAATVPGAAAVYWGLGAPGYPDMPLEARIAALDAGIAARPAQAEQLARLGQTMDAAADAALRAELAAVTDGAALRARYRDALVAGEMAAAVRVQDRLLALVGDAATAQDHADMALALVLEAQGYVSPEAEVHLREALRRDLGHELARYLVGEMFLQGGRFDQAFRFWRPLAETGNPEAPWIASVLERIATVADLAGVRYDGPVAGGPSAAEMAAADALTPEERRAMIEGMVAQLSDRLATEGGDIEDWEQLIRSLVVLERLPEAQAIYDEAKERFRGRPAELSFLRMAAVEGGLSP